MSPRLQSLLFWKDSTWNSFRVLCPHVSLVIHLGPKIYSRGRRLPCTHGETSQEREHLHLKKAPIQRGQGDQGSLGEANSGPQRGGKTRQSNQQHGGGSIPPNPVRLEVADADKMAPRAGGHCAGSAATRHRRRLSETLLDRLRVNGAFRFRELDTAAFQTQPAGEIFNRHPRSMEILSTSRFFKKRD